MLHRYNTSQHHPTSCHLTCTPVKGSNQPFKLNPYNKRINLSRDGGYTDILIAIDEKVPENLDILEKLQVYLKEASQILYRATKNKLYIERVTIMIPSRWMDQQHWLQPAENETFERAGILIAQKNLAYGDTPYTLQPRGCGEEADYIHLTPDFLTTSQTI
ncbi:calcium-activated chloride channel regulator family member 3-like [Watersipora subatra]|uniref:calcium-activated chloride channel regulator family member 3-like n=1 Tax=Watersipora subatra TaxID=2589382 RepID=UPI00355B8577